MSRQPQLRLFTMTMLLLIGSLSLMQTPRPVMGSTMPAQLMENRDVQTTPDNEEPPIDDLPPPDDGFSVRVGMTWTILSQQTEYVHVGADSLTNAYNGDTTIDQFLPILCVLVDGRAAPSTINFDFYNGWLRGAVQATPAIAATVLTSQQQGDIICDDTFGSGWRMAEFHDGRYGADFSGIGGWSFWAAGQLPAGTRFWAAINDQPANPWNSVGQIPAVTMPKFIPSEAPVPGQYLTMFSENTPTSDVASLANSLVAAYGGTIIDIFPDVQGFSFTGNDGQAQAMSQDARVESVEQDTYGQPSEYWHRDRVDQRSLPLDNAAYGAINNGAGVNIYILDTGFRPTHQEFSGRARQDADFIRFLGSRDDCNGHGTAVGSVAGGSTLGIAPGATLISIRIAGCRGNAYNPAVSVFNSTIVAGLDWVAHHHVKPAVANVSYGFSPGFWRRWFNSRTPQDRAVKRAVQAGVTVVVSAGNEGKNADRSTPARAPEAISVSATDGSDKRISWANYGKVDLFAPGLGVTTAGLDSDSDYKSQSGTSFAAPMVAGAAALYLQNHRTASPSEVRSALQRWATPNVVRDPGSGSTNLLLYVNPSVTHAGMTWTVLEQRSNGVVHVGADSRTNAYAGDTPAATRLPILCLFVNNSAVPSGITPDFYNGWARGSVRLSPSVSGSNLDSRATADAICAANFGGGWRMAEFHDGRYGPNLAYTGGWSYWADGTLSLGTRFWTAINDQPANPWN